MNSIKNDIKIEIEDIPCSGRRLEMYEVDGDGTQRMLTGGDVTFKALESAIKSISDSVQVASAGYFPGRNEIAIDVGIHLEQNLTSTDDFEEALDTVFGYLDDAKVSTKQRVLDVMPRRVVVPFCTELQELLH